MTKYRTRTQAIHAGERIDPTTKASAPNIEMSNSFVMSEVSGFSIDAFGDNKPYVYSRWDNPTVRMLEDKLATLENAEACSCFASGMAATSAILNSTLKRGDHLVAIDVHILTGGDLAVTELTRLFRFQYCPDLVLEGLAIALP